MQRHLNKIAKDIDKLYDSNIHTIIKRATPNDKKYLAAIVTGQRGGNDSTAIDHISLIASGNREIKQIVENLKSTTKTLLSELELTKQENKILKSQLKNLDKGVAKLDKTKCKELLKQAQQYIEQFLEVRKAMIELVSFIKKKIITNSKKLKFLSRPPLEYEDDLEALKSIQIKKPSCDNVKGILAELEEYQNPDILNRILSDFENISGTVRVFVRIFNNSFVTPSARQRTQSYDYKIVKDDNKIKKLRGSVTSQCELPPNLSSITNSNSKCLTPSSIVKDGNDIVRTQYPCMNTPEMVPFRYRYGPFFNVLRNQTNKELFKSFKTIIPSLKRGNNVVTFGYGFSGSGKTTTLMGNNKELGLFQLLLKDIEPETTSINLSIRELYGRIEPPTIVSGGIFENKINSKIISHGSLNVTNTDLINPFLNNIKRKQKTTSNNAESSRGHLIVETSITFKNGVSTKFIVIDLAGAEDPFIIGQTFLKIDPLALKSLTKTDVKLLLTDITNPNLKIRSTFWNKKTLDEFAKKTNTNLDILPQEKRHGKIKIKISSNENKKINNIMNRLFLFYLKNKVLGEEKFKQIFTPFKMSSIVDYIWEMLTEGFYINETLNHLKIFIQREAEKKVHVISASSNDRKLKGNVYKTITASEMKTGADKTRYSPDKLFVNPDNDQSIGFINLLESFTKKDKATNFIMIATVRDELNRIHCSGTSNTLDFAHQVKST